MGKTKKPSVSVQCEWSSCTFKGHTVEELSEHMALHLKEHLGDGDAMEELGELQPNSIQYAMVKMSFCCHMIQVNVFKDVVLP